LSIPSDSTPSTPDGTALLNPDALLLASLWRRLIALVYDGFLLFALSLGYGALILIARIWVLGQDVDTTPTNEVFQAALLGGWWLVLASFYVWCWRRSGQTLGMKTWRLQLQQTDGSAPTWKQCWLRSLLAPLALILVIPYAWVLVSKDGNCLHDRWTDTRVVVLPKSKS